MAIQSKEFVGIAEGIKKNELSTKDKIETLRATISELFDVKSSIDSQISYLEATLVAAYEDTDEDGEPDYSRIAAIEAQISDAKNEFFEVDGQLESMHSELSRSETGLESILEEKAQKLFEIQERARKTSNNITVAGGMYGAYSDVGSSIQNSMQTSLTALSQAASILDGSVDGFIGGGSGYGSNLSNNRGITTEEDLSTSHLGAFVVDVTADSNLSGNTLAVSNPSSFNTKHIGSVTSTTSNFQMNKQSTNYQKTSSFNTEQRENAYATSAFTGINDLESATPVANYRSLQSSQNMEKYIIQNEKSKAKSERTPRGDIKRRQEWAKQYQVGFTPTSTNKSLNSNTTPPADNKRGQRELADELEYEMSIDFLLSRFDKNKSTIEQTTTSAAAKSTLDKRNEFLKRLQVDVKPVVNITNMNSDSADDVPNIGSRVRKQDYRYLDREQNMVSRIGVNRDIQNQHHDYDGVQNDIDSIKSKFNAFLQKGSSVKSNDNEVDKAQNIIDNYCKLALKNILSESKQRVRLNDTVEFQDDEKFKKGLERYGNAAGISGYNNGKKSYVKKSGPHPQKTAIHEHNHQLSCNDVKDKFGNITEYRRGISINGKDRQVNEALTEYFTKKMMGAEYPTNPDVAYKYNMFRIEKMEFGFGEKLLKEAYYQNKPQLLKSRYESVMGENTWEKFSRAFDESIKKYADEEVKAKKEYYLKTGKCLTTQTDIIRRKAVDYANVCATLFANKSKGVK